MAESPKVRIALIGGGTIAPLHVKHLMSSPTCELVAIVDPYHPGRELASSLSLPHFESVASLLNALQKPPEAYVICVPSSLHVSIATDVIYRARPKALLIEKPFCTDSKSGTELLALANEKGCGTPPQIPSLAVNYTVAISGLWTAKKDEGYFTSASWRATRSAGGGPIWTNFVHDIDALHFLTGARMTCVWAINTIPRRKHESVAAENIVEEGAAIMAQFSNGVVGTFLVSDNVASPYGWESATGDNPLYPKAEIPVDIYSILGTKGTIVVPDNTLWTYDSETTGRYHQEAGWKTPMTRVKLPVAQGIPFQQQAEHLARVVRDLEDPICSAEDGLAAVSVCEAIVTALKAKDGLPVSVLDMSHI
ncbi:uncharacterized protein N7518_008112 [Penicillium psychrosexuale]|uniref:uncharacterized protein n=1 Tax=Penicillium psychrosexuale TaxID=1002107 RepID=UPI002544DA92|nr:uncharacterized protein N7518_008112 [Penicillium psychrosexuale]KAJ5791101.1 hypothetical protein N7518_008112 [Penicillium psychrosexuale]